MALIVEYHVVADMYPVNANSAGIVQGMLVTLSGGVVVPAPTGTAGKAVLGIAGDSYLSAEGQTNAYSDTVVIGADGAGTRWTSNRVSDFYNETLASQKITVYNGGGKFWISSDLFDTDAAAAMASGKYLIPSAATTAGEWDDAGTAGAESAISVGGLTAYGSGVPGTDVDGHITLGNYVPVILRV